MQCEGDIWCQLIGFNNHQAAQANTFGLAYYYARMTFNLIVYFFCPDVTILKDNNFGTFV